MGEILYNKGFTKMFRWKRSEKGHEKKAWNLMWHTQQ
jgi:hypothetical protein